MKERLRIGEVARLTGVSAKVIRYYEEIRLIPPAPRSESWLDAHGYRLFSDEDVRRLTFIRHARALGFSLDEIRQLLSSAGRSDACARVVALLRTKLDELDTRIGELNVLRNELREFYRSVASSAEDTSPAA